jgi:hypothetical protein
MYPLSKSPNARMNKQTVTTLAKEALKTAPKKKSVTLVQEPVHLADGTPYKPMTVNTSSDALRASLLMLFKHVADVHVTLVEIVAEKFGHSVDEVMNAITEDPRWQNMLVDPLVTDLTAAAKENSVSKPKTKIVCSNEPEIVFD